jgi:acetylornithine/N-succinyldiaminopimelate aminotransferase
MPLTKNAERERSRAPGAPALLDVFHQVDGLEPVRGEGVWITARDGRRYLDFYGGHAVALLGYAHPALVAALDEQARALFFQSNLFDLEVRRRAAESLVGLAPAGLTRAFFVNSGAEANENALRIAFLATGRRRIVAVEGAFHGRTAAAAAITDHHASWYGFPEKPFPVTWVPFDEVAALAAALDQEAAALILEPVQGIAGARPMSQRFMAAARALTKSCGALLIADEVQCGMGRSGTAFACEAYGVAPDLLTTAKGLGGGFPVAAVLATEALAAKIKKGDLGTTFGGGPLACVLADVVARLLAAGDLLASVRRLSQRIRSECCVGPVRAIQGMGFLLGARTQRPAKDVLADLRAKGILAGSSNDPHIVRLMPPLILADEHVDILKSALSEIPS